MVRLLQVSAQSVAVGSHSAAQQLLPVARMSAELTEHRAQLTAQTHQPTSRDKKKKVSRVIRLRRRGKETRTPPRNTLRHPSSWGSCEGLQTLVRNLQGEKNPQDSFCLFCGTRFLMRDRGGVEANYKQLRSGCELKSILYRQFKVIRWHKARIRPDRLESGTGRVISVRQAAKFITPPHATGLLAYRGNTAHPEREAIHRKTKQKSRASHQIQQLATIQETKCAHVVQVVKKNQKKKQTKRYKIKITELRK